MVRLAPVFATVAVIGLVVHVATSAVDTMQVHFEEGMACFEQIAAAERRLPVKPGDSFKIVTQIDGGKEKLCMVTATEDRALTNESSEREVKFSVDGREAGSFTRPGGILNRPVTAI